jgi:hypothetical protein
LDDEGGLIFGLAHEEEITLVSGHILRDYNLFYEDRLGFSYEKDSRILAEIAILALEIMSYEVVEEDHFKRSVAKLCTPNAIDPSTDTGRVWVGVRRIWAERI